MWPHASREEALKAYDLGTAWRTDQDRPTRAGVHEAEAPQNQRAHDPLADLGLRDDERSKLFRRNDKRLHVGDRVRIDQRRLARQLADLGGEIPGPELDDRADTAETSM